MAANPMQRKTRNAFLGGFLIALLLGGIGIFFLYTQLQDVKKENMKKEEVVTVSKSMAYVVTGSLKSGGRLNGFVEYREVPNEAIPSNAATTEDLAKFLVEEGATNYTVGNYLPDEAVAKIDLEPGTVLTKEMIAKSEDGLYEFVYKEQEGKQVLDKVEVNSSVRMVEYNMIALPSTLQPGDYIDIRLQLPTGETFIVVSKKYVESTSANTVWLKMAEEEILAMNNAIVESYIMTGSKLYADVYAEAGNQEKASITYVPSNNVKALIERDENVTKEASKYLSEKYSSTMQSFRDKVINKNLDLYSEDGLGNIEQGITTEIEELRAARQKYMEELGAYQDTSYTEEEIIE